jgi:cytochrome c biogenesis protein CcdA
MYRMIAGLLIVAAGIAGYFVARNFVRRRLRFVDAIYSPLAPWIAGMLAALSMWPVALLPLVSGTTLLSSASERDLGPARRLKR